MNPIYRDPMARKDLIHIVILYRFVLQFDPSVNWVSK